MQDYLKSYWYYLKKRIILKERKGLDRTMHQS